jgi:UDP-3-O-[3-hydroxymyristoyl] N-acetylglucosamine deacetylase
MKQKTLAKQAVVEGPGLHKGKNTTVIFNPAQEGAGIAVKNSHFTYKLSPGLVLDTKRGTTIKYKGSTVHTVEHMLSALQGLGIDNCLIEIIGNEPPAADGSAYPYLAAVKKAGIRTQRAVKNEITIKEPLMLEDEDRFMAVLPWKGFKITYFSDFSKRSIGPDDFSAEITPLVYEKEVSKARTFGFKSEIGWLIKAGLIKGASLKNAILIGEDGKPVNGSLRYPDELTRHKVLDIAGDFKLIQGSLNMHVIAVKTGHKHNIAMAKKIEKTKLVS